MSVKQKKKKTKTKETEEETVEEETVEETQEETSTAEKPDTETKPPREATLTITLIENPVTTEEKIFNAILRVEQLIESDVAISREDLFDLGEDVERQLKEILPEWVNKPWMYVTPEHQRQLDSWCADWSNFILEYARINIKHIIHIEEERASYPFNNKPLKKRLDREQMQRIGEYIVAQEMGLWWDRKKIRLRLYWRTLDEWADIIYEWSLKTGRAASEGGVITVFELQEAKQPWSTIPQEDIYRILEIMEQKGYIEFVNKKKKDTIKFLF